MTTPTKHWLYKYLQVSFQEVTGKLPDAIKVQSFKLWHILLHVSFQVDESASGDIVIFDAEELGHTGGGVVSRVNLDKQDLGREGAVTR